MLRKLARRVSDFSGRGNRRASSAKKQSDAPASLTTCSAVADKPAGLCENFSRHACRQARTARAEYPQFLWITLWKRCDHAPCEVRDACVCARPPIFWAANQVEFLTRNGNPARELAGAAAHQFAPIALLAEDRSLKSHSTGRTTNEPGRSSTSAQAPHFRSSSGDGGFRRLNMSKLYGFRMVLPISRLA